MVKKCYSYNLNTVFKAAFLPKGGLGTNSYTRLIFCVAITGLGNALNDVSSGVAACFLHSSEFSRLCVPATKAGFGFAHIRVGPVGISCLKASDMIE